jgi:hypothetical protein
MEFLFSGVFWGIVIMLFGLSVILKVVFHVHIPVLGIVFGLVIIFFGISIIMHSFGVKGKWHKGTETVFNEATVNDLGEKEYSTVFGKLNLDLSNVDTSQRTIRKEINVVFAGAVIKIPKDRPVKIVANATFAGIRMPDGGATAFGTYVYKSPTFDEGKPALVLKVNTIFGGAEIDMAK